MKAACVVTLLALSASIAACGHKKPKEAKSSAPTSAPAPESGKCEVKGFAYSVPAPGPIAGAVAAADAGAP